MSNIFRKFVIEIKTKNKLYMEELLKKRDAIIKEMDDIDNEISELYDKKKLHLSKLSIVLNEIKEQELLILISEVRNLVGYMLIQNNDEKNPTFIKIKDITTDSGNVSIPTVSFYPIMDERSRGGKLEYYAIKSFLKIYDIKKYSPITDEHLSFIKNETNIKI